MEKAGRPILQAAGPCGGLKASLRPAPTARSVANAPARIKLQPSGGTACEAPDGAPRPLPNPWSLMAGRPWPGWAPPDAEVWLRKHLPRPDARGGREGDDSLGEDGNPWNNRDGRIGARGRLPPPEASQSLTAASRAASRPPESVALSAPKGAVREIHPMYMEVEPQ